MQVGKRIESEPPPIETFNEEVVGRDWKKVLVVVRIARAAGRDFLTGIFSHLAGHDNWLLDLVKYGTDLSADSFRRAVADGLGGLIVTRPCSDATYAAIAESGIPCVFVYETDIAPQSPAMRFIVNDDYAVGRKAAEHLLAHGNYASYAFYGGGENGGWTRQRRKGFCDAVSEKGLAAEVYPENGGVALADWLRSLPRPAALFAENDAAAAVVARTAATAGLSIPKHLALVGADNALHEVSGIGLSSVKMGHQEAGAIAARTLDALMAGKRVSTAPIRLLPFGVVARASTNQRKTPSQLVARAREFIRENLSAGIGVDDVAGHLGVSRSTLDHRFREVTGRSVREAIEAARLAKARKTLASTDKTIASVARECGFSSAARFCHVFRQRFGMAPGRWGRGRGVKGEE